MALRARILTIGMAGALASLQACSGDDSATTGAGGTAGGGGSSGSGGTAGSGGRVDASTGGGGATGGSGGTSTVDDASLGDGNDGAIACLLPQYTHVTTFGAIFDGWNSFNAASFPTLLPATNLETGAPTGTVLEPDPNDGSPDLGSAKLTIPFDGPSQQLIYQKLLGPVNMTGTTVSARIKLDSGLNIGAVNTGQAYFALKSTLGYTYAQGPAIDLDSSAGWVTMSMSTDSAPGMTLGFVTCDIREIDIIIATGALGTYTTAVVHIDTIAITSGDGGAPPPDDGGPPPPRPDAGDAEAGPVPADGPADRADVATEAGE